MKSADFETLLESVKQADSIIKGEVTMQTELITIDRQKARELLALNIEKNRPLNQKRVNNLAEAMRRGEWKENGDTIKISRKGHVLDGQHRLAAIAKCGIPCKYIVVEGLSEDVFDTIDRGSGRTVGDILAIKGEKHYNALAATCRLICIYEKVGNPFHGNPELSPTAIEIENLLERKPEIRDFVQKAVTSKWVRKYLTAKTGAFCDYVFSIDYPDESVEFFSQLNSGVVSSEDSIILKLRDRIMEDKNSTERMGEKYKTALIFKAFKYFRDDRIVKFLRIRQKGSTPEKDWFEVG